MKRPSFQFYPGDWLNDAALRTCSVGARGLWIEMICLMHQGSEYGHLKVNHKVILAPNLARMVGATLQETEGWLNELLEAGVYSVSDDGAMFSRRMIRDEQIRAARAAGGVKGGNPALKGASKRPEKVDEKVNLPANLQPTPSSSSSSSSSLYSVSKDTAAGAALISEFLPDDPTEEQAKAYVWKHGPSALTAANTCDDKNARSMIGQALKKIGSIKTAMILESIANEMPIEPVEYFHAAVQRARFVS